MTLPFPRSMNSAAYLVIQMEIIRLSSVISLLDLESFILKTGLAEEVGPAIDPVLFRNNHKMLAGIKKLAEGFLTVQQSFNELTLISRAHLLAPEKENRIHEEKLHVPEGNGPNLL